MFPILAEGMQMGKLRIVALLEFASGTASDWTYD